MMQGVGKNIGEGIDGLIKLIIVLAVLLCIAVGVVVYMLTKSDGSEKAEPAPQETSWIAPDMPSIYQS